jgi:hypothetical protein
LARFEEALSLEATQFQSFGHTIHFEKLVKPNVGLPPDEALCEVILNKLTQGGRLDGFERVLEGQNYIAGDVRGLSMAFPAKPDGVLN